MHRVLKYLAMTVLSALSAGCSMCQTPYDYCAATLGPNGQPTGGFSTRQGSVLGGVPGAPVYAQAPTPAQVPTPAQMPTPAQPPAAVQAPRADMSVTRPASAIEPVSEQDEAEQAH